MELPENDKEKGGEEAYQYNEDVLAQLEGMGFPRVRCEKALRATGNGNQNAEAAMEWLFAHMEDPGSFPLLVPHFLAQLYEYRYR